MNPRMNTEDSNPPITEMTTRSTKGIEANPNSSAVTRERIPRKKETVNVRKIDAAIFPVMMGDRSSRDISPTCKEVLNLEPREAKIFPRIPIAAGTMMISPGKSSNISE